MSNTEDTIIKLTCYITELETLLIECKQAFDSMPRSMGYDICYSNKIRKLLAANTEIERGHAGEL